MERKRTFSAYVDGDDKDKKEENEIEKLEDVIMKSEDMKPMKQSTSECVKKEEKKRSSKKTEDATKDENLYEFHRRPAPRPESKSQQKQQQHRDVFIKSNTSFVVACQRIRKLIEDNKQPVVVRALGSAISKCCNITVSVQSDYGDQVSMQVETDTVTVVDDFEPLNEELPEISKKRNTSSISITLRRTDSFVSR